MGKQIILIKIDAARFYVYDAFFSSLRNYVLKFFIISVFYACNVSRMGGIFPTVLIISTVPLINIKNDFDIKWYFL